MASICLSAPTTTIVALVKPIPSNPNQISLRNRNSVSFSLPLAFHPLHCSSISTNPRFSSIVSMAASFSDKTNEPLWKSLEKSIENFGKKQSVEDLLRQQIEKREYYDEGGGGGNPPGGRGGGGGGDGFGESEERFAGALDETIQVILATLGFIFMYVYIINGAEMTRLAKDYLSFLFGGRKSIRLTRAMHQWDRFWKNLTAKIEVDRFWLEKAIINTPTWWDSPEKYMRLLKALSPVQPRSDADEDTRDGYEDTREGYDYQGNEEMGDEYY